MFTSIWSMWAYAFIHLWWAIVILISAILGLAAVLAVFYLFRERQDLRGMAWVWYVVRASVRLTPQKTQRRVV